MLDRQLSFYESLFDVERFRKRAVKSMGGGAGTGAGASGPSQADMVVHALLPYAGELEALRAFVHRYLSKSARRYVDFAKLFEFMHLGYVGGKFRQGRHEMSAGPGASAVAA
jgi:hypothetical protein